MLRLTTCCSCTGLLLAFQNKEFGALADTDSTAIAQMALGSSFPEATDDPRSKAGAGLAVQISQGEGPPTAAQLGCSYVLGLQPFVPTKTIQAGLGLQIVKSQPAYAATLNKLTVRNRSAHLYPALLLLLTKRLSNLAGVTTLRCTAGPSEHVLIRRLQTLGGACATTSPFAPSAESLPIIFGAGFVLFKLEDVEPSTVGSE